MNWKKHKVFLISLAILILSGIGLGWEIAKPRVGVRKNNNFFGDQIDKFCINNEACLQKNGEEWLLTAGKIVAPANSESINGYVKKIENIQFGDVISTNQDNFANLGIGMSRVVISANGKSLEIGKINSNYDGTYVREENGKTVYNIEVVLEKSSLGNSGGWINKTITNLALLQTKKITISKNGKVREFTPQNGIWDDPKWMGKVDSLTAVNYLQSFFPGNETRTVIAVETENNKLTLTLGESIQIKKGALFWATTDQKYYYSISADDYHLLTGKIN